MNENTPEKKEKEEEEQSKKEESSSVLAAALQKLTLKENVSQKHQFWSTQPVPKYEEKNEGMFGSIDPIKTVEEIRKEPYNLPEGYEWVETNVDDEKTIQEIYELLNQNYVEDDDNMFRFDYSIPFLRWAIKPPGWRKDWHIGVQVKKTKKLVGFITAVPAHIQIYDNSMKMVEINFLCVHKKLRDKRLAPVLIKEITRRVNLTDVWQAVYTAGKVLPKPLARARYWHRSLNPKKLVEVGFSHLGPRMTLNRTIKLYKLPDEPQSKGIRLLQAKDVPSATKLLNNYLKAFFLRAHFTEEEFAHYFIPKEGIISSYCIENPKTHEITDMVSFYTLPSSILGHPNHKILKAAYSYYNVATSVSLEQLMNDALIFAKKEKFDVFNCLDIMQNETFLKELKFGKGDGNLQFYLYNWRCPDMEPSKIGLVLM